MLPSLIVLVIADEVRRHRTEALLAAHGFLVTAATSYPEAREFLRSVSPDLLIADVRLEAFNGLHLAVYCHLRRPALPVIITHTEEDAALAAEALRLGAIFVSDPLDNPDFMSIVQSAITRRAGAASRIRQWPRKRALPDLQARLGSDAARVVDVSYGGVKLAFGGEREVPGEFELTLPDAHITVRAQRIWTTVSAELGEFWCGAAVVPIETSPPTAWREFVDSVG